MKIKIKLIRSKIGKKEKHRRILSALGLRRINQEVIKEDTPSIRGMIKKVDYMVAVEKLDDT